jgi:hypothetical protein
MTVPPTWTCDFDNMVKMRTAVDRGGCRGLVSDGRASNLAPNLFLRSADLSCHTERCARHLLLYDWNHASVKGTPQHATKKEGNGGDV